MTACSRSARTNSHSRDQAPRQALAGLRVVSGTGPALAVSIVGPRAMSNQWFGTQRELRQANSRPGESQPSGDRELEAAASPHPPFRKEEAFWRSWLATGARRVPIDRRRARGAEAHLKKILVGAVDFSSAMARQAIEEALHELTPQHKQIVKLAYFGGFTNREIAQDLGLSGSEVRRLLRASLASVSAHFERGRAKGRRAIQDLALAPLWRGIVDSAHRTPWPGLDQVLQTGIVAVMTAAAAAMLVAHQAPVHTGHAHKPTQVSAASPQSAAQPIAEALSQTALRHGPLVSIDSPLVLPLSVAAPSLLAKSRAPEMPQLSLGE